MLVTADLEAMRVRVIGSTGFPFSAALALCPSEGEDRERGEDRKRGVAYTITNTFGTAQLAKLDLGTGAARLVGSPPLRNCCGERVVLGRTSVRSAMPSTASKARSVCAAFSAFARGQAQAQQPGERYR
jgi:hypothetical protein